MASSSSSDVVTLCLACGEVAIGRKGEEFLEVEVVLEKGLPFCGGI